MGWVFVSLLGFGLRCLFVWGCCFALVVRFAWCVLLACYLLLFVCAFRFVYYLCGCFIGLTGVVICFTFGCLFDCMIGLLFIVVFFIFIPLVACLVITFALGCLGAFVHALVCAWYWLVLIALLRGV